MASLEIRMAKPLALIMVLTVLTMAQAEKHHVVGDDRGWDPATDVGSWSSAKTFKVGDKLWFAHSASHGTIAEVKTKEEYDSCDITNPIKILSDGIESILLDGEGIRYFVSSNTESCKNGLKLPIEVISQKAPDDTPKIITSEGDALVVAADGPTTPSSSGRIGAPFAFFVALFCLCFMLS